MNINGQSAVILQKYKDIQKYSKMEQLTRLIKDASNQFECHNFQTSLSLYTRCINKCQTQKMPSYLLHNLKSSQAALRAILGEQETALSILNSVLAENKMHWLSLLRRSQIYKKQNKLKNALKDIEVLTMFAPDNMQVSAFKLQIQTLLAKNKSSLSDIESSEQEIDEEKCLQFSNLKKIDRTSISIMCPKKGRQSRVTISGDRSFCYESQFDQSQISRTSIKITPHFIKQKFIEIQGELEETVQFTDHEIPLPQIVIKAPKQAKKSILRNRDSKIYVEDSCTKNLISTAEGRKLVQKLQDIEGHMIGSEHGSAKDFDEREVQFKKSSYNKEDPEVIDLLTPKKNKQVRKSCLKRSSFSSNIEIEKLVTGGKRRSSKFDNISRISIDGKVIKHDVETNRRKQQKQRQSDKQNINSRKESNESGDQSEEGSHYNIFGSRKIDINKELRQNFGFKSDQIREIQDDSKKEKKRGCSILKKTSIVVKKDAAGSKQNKTKKTSVFFKTYADDEQKPDKKSKKSVMFRTC